MINGTQRGHKLSDIIADIQHHISRTKTAPETPLVQQALDKLYEARTKAKEDKTADATEQ